MSFKKILMIPFLWHIRPNVFLYSFICSLCMTHLPRDPHSPMNIYKNVWGDISLRVLNGQEGIGSCVLLFISWQIVRLQQLSYVLFNLCGPTTLHSILRNHFKNCKFKKKKIVNSAILKGYAALYEQSSEFLCWCQLRNSNARRDQAWLMLYLTKYPQEVRNWW